MKTVGMFLLYLILMGVSHATIIENQEYFLLDHPSSALTSSHGPYGLRLDSLAPPVGAGPTFSTELGGARVTLEWNGMEASILGTVYNNTTMKLWEVSQTLTDIVAVTGGFKATGGELVLTDPYDNIFVYSAVPDGSGNVFRADNSGHRCNGHDECGPLVARGWLLPKAGDFEKDDYGKVFYGTNDWLVQLTPVPVPAALPLLISGLLGFSLISRKRKS